MVSPKQMQEFASKYSKLQWEYLCKKPEFLRAITDDLKTAQNIADKLFTVKTPAKSYAKKNQ